MDKKCEYKNVGTRKKYLWKHLKIVISKYVEKQSHYSQ